MRFYEIIREGEDDAGWYRGISKQEADDIRRGGLPQPSAVPIAMDNEVMDYLGYDDDEAWELQKELEGEQVINVTSDQQNAEGYGDELLWFERSLIGYDLKPYGIISLSMLQGNPDGWGLVGADEVVNEAEDEGKIKTTWNMNDGIAVRAYVDGNLAGTYEYKDNHHLADVQSEYQQQGIGSFLLLKVLDIAADKNISVYRDESETGAYQALIDSLEQKQYIIVDDAEDELMISQQGYEWLDKQEKQEQVNEDEEKPLPPEVERWIEGRSPEDVSVDEIKDSKGNTWVVHVEGFTDDCQSDEAYCEDPDAVIDEVWSDHEQRQGKKAYEQLIAGDGEYPIVVSIFRK